MIVHGLHGQPGGGRTSPRRAGAAVEDLLLSTDASDENVTALPAHLHAAPPRDIGRHVG